VRWAVYAFLGGVVIFSCMELSEFNRAREVRATAKKAACAALGGELVTVTDYDGGFGIPRCIKTLR
jgi:hypothetical protein